MRPDHREEPTEQLPTQQARYRGRKLRHDLLGRVHVGHDLVEDVDVNDHSRHALVEAPPQRHRLRSGAGLVIQPLGGQSSVKVVSVRLRLLRVGETMQVVPRDVPRDVDHALAASWRRVHGTAARNSRRHSAHACCTAPRLRTKPSASSCLKFCCMKSVTARKRALHRSCLRWRELLHVAPTGRRPSRT